MGGKLSDGYYDYRVTYEYPKLWTTSPVSDSNYEVASSGAKQHEIGVRYDLIDACALRLLAELLYNGEKEFGKDNWRGISRDSHINHAIAHLMSVIEKEQVTGIHDDTLMELTHAFCRIMFAIGVSE